MINQRPRFEQAVGFLERNKPPGSTGPQGHLVCRKPLLPDDFVQSSEDPNPRPRTNVRLARRNQGCGARFVEDDLAGDPEAGATGRGRPITGRLRSTADGAGRAGFPLSAALGRTERLNVLPRPGQAQPPPQIMGRRVERLLDHAASLPSSSASTTCLPSPRQGRDSSTEVGIPTSLYTEVGFPTSLSLPILPEKSCGSDAMGSASLPELGFIPKNPSPGQRRRSVSDAVLAVLLTECFFSPLTRPAVNPAVATGLPLSILLRQQDCSTQSCCGNRIAPPNPAVAILPLSILGWAQDCFTHSCADSRIAPVHYEQLGLGTVLPRAQACDGAGPAVEGRFAETLDSCPHRTTGFFFHSCRLRRQPRHFFFLEESRPWARQGSAPMPGRNVMPLSVICEI